MSRAHVFARFAVAAISIGAICAGLVQLHQAREGLSIASETLGSTPLTIFRPLNATTPSPVIVIAHGFAGSQQLMQPFAMTLAHAGYTAVTFDFLGHGRNPVPMRGDIMEGTSITLALLNELSAVADFARKLPGTDGRVGVLGHSMASDIVVRYAMANPDVTATVAVSVFSPVATATSPRNLLVIVGSAEPTMLKDEGFRIVNLGAGGHAIERETYGQFSDGTARRLVLANGVEHIGVLYSYDSMTEALAWMNRAFERQDVGLIDRRGVPLALLFAGIIALAWPLSSLLPTVTQIPMGANLAWKPLLVAAFGPAIATPLILWKAPTDFLPILLGDYLALHFALYAILTFAFIRFAHRTTAAITPNSVRSAISIASICAAAVAVSAYEIIGFGWPTDTYAFSFLPIAPRIPLIAVIACATLPYFMADEWLTRGALARRGAYPLTKFCFLLSLAIAVLINPQKLFFLVIIVPAILLLFIAFGLISQWTYARTRHPLPGALANALIFAWAIGVTFPLIVR